MAATSADDINRFVQFAMAKVCNEGAELSLEELLDLWRAENPRPDQRHEDILAVNAAIRDMESGDQGQPAEEVIVALRQRHNFPTDA